MPRGSECSWTGSGRAASRRSARSSEPGSVLLAPSDELRRWYHSDPDRWDEFRERYFAELAEHGDSGELAELLERVRAGRVTLLYSSRDEHYNNAVALREYLLRAAR